MRNAILALAGIAAIGWSCQALAQNRTETVQFKRSASSATLSGTIRGYDGIGYRLGASAGQAMSVLFKPGNASCYFNVLAPGSCGDGQPTADCKVGGKEGRRYGGGHHASGLMATPAPCFSKRSALSGTDLSQADGGTDIRMERENDLIIARVGKERFEIADIVVFGD